MHELPCDETTAMVLRSNAHDKRVINVSLLSMEVALALAPSLGRLRAAVPQHSLAFYCQAPAEGLPCIPGVVRDHYTTITWDQMHPGAGACSPAAHACLWRVSPGSDVLRTIEASFLRGGSQPQLGMTPAQRMGLEHVPYRDAAMAALAEETRRKAAYWTSLEGGVHNTKRIRLNDFQRGAGIVTVKDHADFGAHMRA